MVVPWARLVERLRPLYPKGERGRPPIGLERMLRIYFLQQWYGLADEALEDALYDSQALRGFAGIESEPRHRCRMRRRCCTSAIGWSGSRWCQDRYALVTAASAGNSVSGSKSAMYCGQRLEMP